MKKIVSVILAVILSNVLMLYAQSVGINTDGSDPDASAMLDVKSTTGGFLTPRMTETQKSEILSPATGLMVYQTDGEAGYYYFNGLSWVQISTSSLDLAQGKIFIGDITGKPAEQAVIGDVTLSETGVTTIGSAKVTNDMLAGSITNDKLAGGITNDQLAGSISNDKLAGGITSDKLTDGTYMITTPGTNGQVWTSDGAGAGTWANAISDNTLSQGKIFIGNASNEAEEQTIVGDVTMSETGVTTIGSEKVTNDMLAGSITNDKLAGGITNDQLAGSITDDKLDTISSADKVAGSAVQLNATGGLVNDSGLKIENSAYMITTPGTNGQVWTSDGSGAGTWADATSDNTLSQGKIFIGNASNVAEEQNIVGDVTITETGVTSIGSAKVTNDMIAGSISDDKLTNPSKWTTSGSDIYYNSGNIGIGTTSPTRKLDISGNTMGLTADDSDGLIVIDNADNDRFSALALQYQGGEGVAFLGLGGSSYSYFGGNNSLNFWNQTPNGPLSFGTHNGTATAERLRIDALGNVGIGTSSPGAKLQIEGDGSSYLNVAEIIRSTGTTYGSSLRLESTGTNGKSYALYSGQASDPAGAGVFSIFEDGGGDRLVIKNGNVGIGTTTPSTQLELGINTSGTPTYNFFSAGNAGGDNTPKVQFSLENTAANLFEIFGKTGVSSLSSMMSIDLSNGNVGIGTATPDAPLHVSGAVGVNAGARYFNGGTDLIVGTTDFNMSIHASNDIVANGSFVATSDKRVKENITELNNSLDLISKLRPVSYNKIDKVEQGNRLNYGFIAQEVEEVIPIAVNTGKGEVPVLKPFEMVNFEGGVSYTILVKNGDDIKEQTYTKGDARPTGEIIVKSKTVDDFKSLSYDTIFTVAVDAIQEQQVIIEKQQQQIDELTKLVQQLLNK